MEPQTTLDRIRFFADGGRSWACGQQQHPPSLCSFCRYVDGTLETLLLLVEDGLLNWTNDSDGDFRFQLTAEGMGKARSIYERFGLNPDDPSKANLKAVFAHLDEEEQR